MKKVIFDTDIGIDDAMALLYLHYAPDVDLRAIVSGYGNADIDTTTRNALYMKQRFGIDAPVFRGAESAIALSMFDGYPDFVHGRNGLGDIEIGSVNTQAEEIDGAEAIVDLVTQNPNEMSIVAVGRMTNLAHAIAMYPELPGLVKEVVVMGGVFGFNGHRGNVSPVAEANIAGDPTAADQVFTSGLPLTIVGLDVTHETVLDDSFFESLRKNAGEAGKFIYEISRYYVRYHEHLTGRRECPMHDSSAVACLIGPEMFERKRAVVRVAIDGIALGQTIWAEPGSHAVSEAWRGVPACEICTGVDSERVLDHYLETLALAQTN